MKRWLFVGTILATIGGAIAVQQTSRGQLPASNPPRKQGPADLGPDDGGATLKRPGMEVPTAPSPTLPDVSRLWNPQAAPNPLPSGMMPHGQPAKRIAQLPSNPVEVNKDIEVTEKAGPWLILLMSYSGEKAPYQARKFVQYLRETLKINAYVFNYGAEEKRQEYARAEAEREKQRAALRAAGLTTHLPIPVRVTRIDESTGVLIGGYPSREEALKALLQLRSSKIAPDPKQVDLQILYIGEYEGDKMSGHPAAKINVKQGEQKHDFGYVNPFVKAFPVRNPRLQHQAENPVDVAKETEFLRKINDGNPLTLFQCNKPYTLAVKEYRTAMMLKDEAPQPKGFFDRFLWKQPEKIDYAAQSAHTLAEGFRQAGLPQTYVLHARYGSYVTVGGYDSLEDPALLAMQNFLEGRFKMPALQPLDLMPRPVPMMVPR